MLVVFSFFMISPVFATITGNNTEATAYNYGNWSMAKSDTIILPAGEQEAYFKFTINQGDKIYVRCSYDNKYEGMGLEVLNGSIRLGQAVSPNNVVDAGSVMPFLAVNCNGTKSNQTYYVKITRGNCDINTPIYCTLSFYNRIKSGYGTFNFVGTASNSGGGDSPVLTLDLAINTKIPVGAVVKSITTSSSQSPSQGNVHHMLKPADGSWYTSKVSSATSGAYNISLTNNFMAAQKWQFKYNAKALGKSKMTNVKLNITWEYDITLNGYKAFVV